MTTSPAPCVHIVIVMDADITCTRYLWLGLVVHHSNPRPLLPFPCNKGTFPNENYAHTFVVNNTLDMKSFCWILVHNTL